MPQALSRSITGLLLIVLTLAMTFRSSDAQDVSRSTTTQKERFFETDIRPLLIKRCLDCHSGDESDESSLAITSRGRLLKGADFGPTILSGRSEDSVLIQVVKWTHKELRMPPNPEDRLSRDEVATLAKWIDDGAVWPASSDIGKSPTARAPERLSGKTVETDHWSFQPRRVVAPPEVDDARWSTNAIDRFLEEARQARGLTAVREADRRTLIRRVTFDLIGLPPTPAEITDFVNDSRSDEIAYSAVVDRLLQSSHYGERWGRHWLDVARYADTQGDVGDIPIPDAWQYRNWVIDALNDDMPFDRFLQAQIAGDVIAAELTATSVSSLTNDGAEADTPVTDETVRDLIVATGFVSLAQRFGNSKKDQLHLTIENTIDTLGRGVLGLTLRCSRCHDHPFDPILQTDYYGLYGIFDSTTYPWMGMSIEKSPSALAPVTADPAAKKQVDEFWKTITRYEYQINNHFRPWLKPTLDEFKQVNRDWQQATKAGSAPDKLTQQRDELLARYKGRFRELMLHGLAWLKKEKETLAENPPVKMVFAVGEGQPHDANIHRRGEPTRKGPVTPRRFLQVTDGPDAPRIEKGSGRLELARWLTKPDHPLVPRVIVNRIWQQHFGSGLVSTSDNLGVRGEKPSHPELLDWLAEQFVNQHSWSLKALHRRIVLTRTYRLSSLPDWKTDDANAGAGETDPRTADSTNTYLWRFQRRRLEAEAIRDAILTVSGQLDLSPGGPHPLLAWHKKRYGLNGPFHEEYETSKRSVYLLTQRLFDHSFLGLFDSPDTNQTTSQRTSADVAGQALFLMNSPFIRQQADAFAKRLLRERKTTPSRLDLAFTQAYGRPPDSDERARLTDFINQFSSRVVKEGVSKEGSSSDTSKGDAERRTWTAVARTILTSNEFFFVD
jgi:hypothetical protein